MKDKKDQCVGWIDDFWELVEKSPDSIKNSEYNQIRLEGFLIARRNMPVIELPKDDGTISQNAYQLEVISMLKSAGIKYTIKGE